MKDALTVTLQNTEYVFLCAETKTLSLRWIILSTENTTKTNNKHLLKTFTDERDQHDNQMNPTVL